MADNEMEPPLRIPELEESHKYHAFIAHSTDDRDFTEELTTTLEDMKFKCFMYERDLPPDSTIINGVSSSIRISRRVILVVTEAFIKSRWIVFEAMEALHKGYNEDRMVLIPVLYKITPAEIPHYLRNHICLEYNEKNFWKRLKSALVEDRPATTLIPAGNVAHGLAWSYFYGFLKLVLPGIITRSENFISTKKGLMANVMSGMAAAVISTPSDSPEMLRKMVIIIPSSCNCPEKVQDLGPDLIRFEGFIDFSATRAGNIKRNYKSSVYRVKDPESGKEYLFIAEFATPVLSMYEMEVGGLAGLTNEQKMQQRMLFSDKLAEILAHPDNRKCSNKATLMEWNDETEEGRGQFPKLLCQHIRRELKKEKDLQDQIDKISDGYGELSSNTFNERLLRFHKAEKLKEALQSFLSGMQLASGIDVDDQLLTIFIAKSEEETARKALQDELRNIKEELHSCHKVVAINTAKFTITRDDGRVGGGSRIYYKDSSGVQKYVTLGAVFVDCINNNKPYILTTCHLDNAIGTDFFSTCHDTPILLGKCVASVVQKNPLMEACLVEINQGVFERCSACLSTGTVKSPVSFRGPYTGSLPELLANPREVLKCGGPSMFTRGRMKYYAYDFVDPSDGCMIYGGIVTYPIDGEAFTERGDSGAIIGLASSQSFYVENWCLRHQLGSACRYALSSDQPSRRVFAADTVDSLTRDDPGVEQATPVAVLHGIQSPPVSLSSTGGAEGGVEVDPHEQPTAASAATGEEQATVPKSILTSSPFSSSSGFLLEDEEQLPSSENSHRLPTSQTQGALIRDAPEEVMTHEAISAHCFGLDLPDGYGQMQRVSVSFRVNLSIYKLQEQICAELKLAPLLKGSM